MITGSSPIGGGSPLSHRIARVAARSRWAALALGGLAACGFEPLGLWSLTLVSLAGFLALLARTVDVKQAAVLGWLFGLGHFVIGNNWIATAFTYQANMPQWLGWIAVVLLSTYLAVYPMLAALGAWAARRNPLAMALAFGGWWIVTEWLRSWVFTGYAWNPLAMVALGPFDRPGLAGVAPWMGTYALSGLVALAGGLLFWAIRQGRRAVVGICAFALIVVFQMPWPQPQTRPGSLAYTLVQPDVRQEVLDDPTQWEEQFQRTAALSLPHPGMSRRIVLWPESGVPDYLRDGYPEYLYVQTTFAGDPRAARARIGRVLGPGGLLMTGAVDLELEGRNAVAARNVITALDNTGAIRGGYAKAHLVPYGEYLPLRGILEPLGLSRLVPGALDFRPGPGPQTLDFGAWGKAGMQICYEIVFSGQVTDRRHRPDYIFNPSNDGWFGSWGPPQHLAQARLRAIEEGLPVLRATTTGISGVIDANGVVVRHIPRHVAARVDGIVPAARAPTAFARLGNLLALCWGAVLLGLSLVALRRWGG
ncbi:MAG: apolipoprotein N-acyltransferase [Novosphingobium sp.]